MELNREQIIKALECCHTQGKDCLSCPYENDHSNCVYLEKNALFLIKELTEDIEWSTKRILEADKKVAELTEENDKLVEAGFDTVDYAIDKIRALEKEIELMRANRTEYFNRAQVSAIRLFAEKLKQAICDHTYPDFDKAGKPVNVWKATTGYDVIDELETELIKEIRE